MKTNLNDAINKPFTYLSGREWKDKRPLSKWELRAQPSYRLLTNKLSLPKGANYATEKRERRVFAFKYNASVISAAILAIVIGLLLGVVLLLTMPDRIGEGLSGFFYAIFPQAAPIPIYDQVISYQIFYKAGPLLFCALSVGFCYKCGLFNIGGSGQFTLGGMVALVFAIFFHTHWLVGLLLGIVFGMLVGVIPGLLKAFFNINEVITSIMLNWITLFICNVLFYNVPGVQNSTGEQSINLATLSKEYPNLMIPRFDDSGYLNITIVVGIVIAIILAIVLFKTSFGYKLRAVGFNRDGARCAGISDKKNIILSFLVAGGLCGLGGAFFYLLGPDTYLPSVSEVASQGFDAIPIALLANNNPIGIIFTTLFISMLQVGGQGLQPNYNKEFIDIVIAIILYVSGFAALIQNVFLRQRRIKPKKSKALKEDLVLPESSVKTTPESIALEGGKENVR